mgnify:CR=1 FL=1
MESSARLVRIFCWGLWLEIIEHRMDDSVRAIVLGSDGIFEVLNNAVIMAVVQKHYAKRNAEGAAEE